MTAVLVAIALLVVFTIGYTAGEVFTEMRWERRTAGMHQRINEFVVLLDGELRRPQNGVGPSHGGTVVPLFKEDGQSEV